MRTKRKPHFSGVSTICSCCVFFSIRDDDGRDGRNNSSQTYLYRFRRIANPSPCPRCDVVVVVRPSFVWCRVSICLLFVVRVERWDLSILRFGSFLVSLAFFFFLSSTPFDRGRSIVSRLVFVFVWGTNRVLVVLSGVHLFLLISRKVNPRFGVVGL